MSRTLPTLIQRQMVDDTVLAYVEWREECSAVWEAYAHWSHAPAERREDAHAAYRAALDREQAAADSYAELIERIGTLLEPVSDRPQTRGSSWG